MLETLARRKHTSFAADDFSPNEETVRAMEEYYEMKENPQKYKRYSSFKAAVSEALDEA